MANKVLDFQRKLLTDDVARRAFAANPARYLEQAGIELPANVTPPAFIPLDELEAQVTSLQRALTEQHMDIADLPVNDPSAMTRFIEGLSPRSASGLKLAQAAGAETGIVTIDTVCAVTLIVVTVPLAVAGRDSQSLSEMVQAMPGIEGISRVGSGYRLYGPGGLRVEGLDTAGVVNIIKGLR
ncbi:MAG: hypothetical protein ABSG25_06515 [Bryobacteraceae bacterium]